MAKILIIDDDRAVVDSTADMLKSFEFNVITATDGKKGFELADLERPDVIILDWILGWQRPGKIDCCRIIQVPSRQIRGGTFLLDFCSISLP